LFFSVQLAVGKIITPIFGGTAWVWVLVLLFFQASLLIGYFMAGLFTNRNPRYWLFVLGGLMIVSSLIVPLPERWGLNLFSYELLDVLVILVFSMALPSIVLSSATITLQRTAYNLDITPWQLYFYSNIGSISAVLLYPLVIENAFTITTYMILWKIMLFSLGLMIIVVAFFINDNNEVKIPIDRENNLVSKFTIFKWIILSCIPSAMLAITSVILTQDIAPVPFLWALPLATFLIAFALPFAPKPILAKWPTILISTIFVSVLLLSSIKLVDLNGTRLAVIHIALLFTATWICVTQLIINKPSANRLQYFYICIAIGGLIGTTLVSIVAPLTFTTYSERIIILIVIYVIPYFIYFNEQSKRIKYAKYLLVHTIIFLTFFAVSTYTNKSDPDDNLSYTIESIHNSRSMYGVISVYQKIDSNGSGERMLIHGNTRHGSQLITEKKLDNTVPTAYYGYNSPLKFFFDKINRETKESQVAIIGLGAGVMNYYSTANIKTTYFEIDGNMVDVALEYFTFLELNDDNYKIEIGDGRRLITEKPNDTYAMVIVDAFSSDSIPTHLITTEAINIYFEKLKDDGILLIHVSNRYVDIEVIADVVLRNNGYYSYIYEAEKSDEALPSIWVIGSKTEIEELDHLPQVEILTDTSLFNKTWTDHFTPLLPFLKTNW